MRTMDPKRCLEGVWENHAMRQCKNRPHYGKYCFKHQPELVQRRKTKGPIKHRFTRMMIDSKKRVLPSIPTDALVEELERRGYEVEIKGSEI